MIGIQLRSKYERYDWATPVCVPWTIFAPSTAFCMPMFIPYSMAVFSKYLKTARASHNGAITKHSKFQRLCTTMFRKNLYLNKKRCCCLQISANKSTKVKHIPNPVCADKRCSKCLDPKGTRVTALYVF